MRKKILSAALASVLMLLAFSGCGETVSPDGTADYGYEFYNYNLDDFVEIGEFSGIRLKAEEVTATEQDGIDRFHQFLVSQTAVSKMPVTDRPVEKGDFVNIDFEGKMDGEAFAGGTSEDYDLEIGSGKFIPGFEDGLIGAAIGQTLDLNLTFPDPYQANPDYSGKPVVFTVTVNSIQAYSYPELTDEYVKQNFSTYASARDMLDDLVENCSQDLRWNAVRDAVIGSATVKVYPDKEVNEFEDELNGKYQEYADSFGMELSDFVKKYLNMDYDTYCQQVTDYAKDQVRSQMVCVAIARREGIALTPEEFRDYLEYYTSQYSYESTDECLQKFGKAKITVLGLVDTVIAKASEMAIIE